MIALDTNAIVRLLLEDDASQAATVRSVIRRAEKEEGRQIVVLPEVLIETVWVLESAYTCTRPEIHAFLKAILNTSIFTVVDAPVIASAIRKFKDGGDFADHVIVGQARRNKAQMLLSFDRNLQRHYPGFVVAELPRQTAPSRHT